MTNASADKSSVPRLRRDLCGKRMRVADDELAVLCLYLGTSRRRIFSAKKTALKVDVDGLRSSIGALRPTDRRCVVR